MSSIFKSTTVWTGNTYPHRDFIKSLGGTWDKERKAWIVPSLTMRQRENLRVPSGVNVERLDK